MTLSNWRSNNTLAGGPTALPNVVAKTLLLLVAVLLLGMQMHVLISLSEVKLRNMNNMPSLSLHYRGLEGTDSAPDMLKESLPATEPPVEEKERNSGIGLVRPFTSRDFMKLRKSFDEWDRLVPCSPKSTTSGNVDLFLLYSREISDDHLVQSELAQLLLQDSDATHEGQEWRKCFRHIEVLSLGLTAEQDIYSRDQQGKRLDWVAGPNHEVFRRAFRTMQMTDTYETMFFVEPDVHPLKEYWLDSIVDEIKSKRPFSRSLEGEYDLQQVL
jgi:hypothetical protein